MITRFHASRLVEMLDLFPVVALVGPRQVGKSTLVTTEPGLRGRTYLTLDDIGNRSLAMEDPKTFLDRPGPLTIDEVQLAPGLLREIKLRIDQNRVSGAYLLTGSADLDHCAELSEVLAGRVGILELPAITRSEQSGANGWRLWLQGSSVQDWDDAFHGPKVSGFDFQNLTTGGFPPSLNAPSPRARRLWMESFAMTYLDRDLRRVADIGNIAEFHRLMQLTAARTGTILNQAELARDAGISSATAGRYLSILEASLLLRRVPPFFANIGKRLVKSPKALWLDTGICAFLLGLTEARSSDLQPTIKGRLFETFVTGEILALLPLIDQSVRPFHIRTHDQLEIDGCLDFGTHQLLYEIKAGRTLSPDDARPLEKWMDLNPGQGPAAVIYAGDTYQPLSPRVRAIPFSSLFE